MYSEICAINALRSYTCKWPPLSIPESFYPLTCILKELHWLGCASGRELHLNAIHSLCILQTGLHYTVMNSLYILHTSLDSSAILSLYILRTLIEYIKHGNMSLTNKQGQSNQCQTPEVKFEK